MENAFLDCKKLQTINSLAKVTKFNDEAFSGCVSLTSVGEVNPEASVGRNVFYNCSKLAQRDILDPEASIHDISSDWSVNNASRIGWIKYRNMSAKSRLSRQRNCKISEFSV